MATGRQLLKLVSLVATLATLSSLAACSLFNRVEIESAQQSLDGTRLALVFMTCNSVTSATVEERDDVVRVFPQRLEASESGGETDCLDEVVVQLAQPLGDRAVVNDSSGNTVDVAQSPPADALDWPYDRTLATSAEYERALERMVDCLEDADPHLTARVVPGLNWNSWSFDKAPDHEGNLEVPAIEECDATTLAPLR